LSDKTGIEWTDSTWSPVRVRVREDAGRIAREKGYSSLVQIAEKMAGRAGQHCEHVSPGCAHCYAETHNHRCLPDNGTGLPYDRRARDLVEAFVEEKALLQPLKWKAVVEHTAECEARPAVIRKGSITAKGIKKASFVRRRRIFVQNQTDLFGEWITDEMRDRVFAVMALCPQHDFQVLTKRPERMLAYLTNLYSVREVSRLAVRAGTMAAFGPQTPEWLRNYACQPGFDHARVIPPLPNVWNLTSIENQETADLRVPIILQVPSAVRGISAEPLLGPVMLPRKVHLARSVRGDFPVGHDLIAMSGYHVALSNPHGALAIPMQDGKLLGIKPQEFEDCGLGLDWVICGGESGAGARPMDVQWARELAAQCHAADVPFFMKQLGAVPMMSEQVWREDVEQRGNAALLKAANRNRVPEGFVPLYCDGKGGDFESLPPGLRIRQFPGERA
jgi:protein gp37